MIRSKLTKYFVSNQVIVLKKKITIFFSITPRDWLDRKITISLIL